MSHKGAPKENVASALLHAPFVLQYLYPAFARARHGDGVGMYLVSGRTCFRVAVLKRTGCTFACAPSTLETLKCVIAIS